MACNMLKILILYDIYSMHIGTVREHVSSFQKFSNNEVFYCNATHKEKCALDLTCFDVVVIHYCVRLSLDWHLSDSFETALKKYSGIKVLFIQDEYEHTELARSYFEKLDFKLIYTVIPDAYRDKIYPKSRFPNVIFKQTLTGFVPSNYLKLEKYIKPMRDRNFIISYRGRDLPFWYGNLCQEKVIIAKRMKVICAERSLPVDIEWDDNKRIYGNDWFNFIAKSKATLGTESGSNVFDEYGLLKQKISEEIKINSDISYDEIFNKYLKEHEGLVKMNQISPRIFEAIALKTALVLFEGNYSGVIIPNIHYIPLKKDFSNVDDVFRMLSDDVFLEKMVERAYEDIIESQKYSYRTFVEEFDQTIKQVKEEYFSKLTTKNDDYEFILTKRQESFYKNLNLQIAKNLRRQKCVSVIIGMLRIAKRLLKKTVSWTINSSSLKVNG